MAPYLTVIIIVLGIAYVIPVLYALWKGARYPGGLSKEQRFKVINLAFIGLGPVGALSVLGELRITARAEVKREAGQLDDAAAQLKSNASGLGGAPRVASSQVYRPDRFARGIAIFMFLYLGVVVPAAAFIAFLSWNLYQCSIDPKCT